MTKTKKAQRPPLDTLPKCPTGIKGLDEVTGGGLPQGRPTLVCGNAGCGKTVLGMEFLVRGSTEYEEPGVFMSFEETEDDLIKNFTPIGFDLPALIERKKIALDYVFVDRGAIEETGEYDLEGLFIRLAFAIDQVGAKRVVLDTIESLFSGLSNEGILRAELRRLFRWLKEKGVTALITAEQGRDTLTRHGLEEYVADCVIALDHRVIDQISTRRLRVIKYRGSVHGADEHPFLIQPTGISLLPITSLNMDHTAPTDRVSTGIERLDTMLGGKGYYRGSAILVSGSAGTGKTSVGAHFVDSACRNGHRAVFLAFEESPSQIVRNMRSIGIDLDPWEQKELLRFHAIRPTRYGLESHLARIHILIDDFKPAVVVIDPVSNLVSIGSISDVKLMLTRLMDFLKTYEITTLCTDLTAGGTSAQQTEIGLSSLMDTWILLRSLESDGERNRTMYIAKSRGIAHSDQVREFLLTDNGVELVDVYLGTAGVLTGSARAAREALDTAQELARRNELERKQRELERKRTSLKAQLATLKAEFEAEEEELQQAIDQEVGREKALDYDQRKMARLRRADET
jgi:circadian clock protein KaiC